MSRDNYQIQHRIDACFGFDGKYLLFRRTPDDKTPVKIKGTESFYKKLSPIIIGYVQTEHLETEKALIRDYVEQRTSLVDRHNKVVEGLRQRIREAEGIIEESNKVLRGVNIFDEVALPTTIGVLIAKSIEFLKRKSTKKTYVEVLEDVVSKNVHEKRFAEGVKEKHVDNRSAYPQMENKSMQVKG